MTALRNDMIRRLREAAGLTQEKLAEAAGVSPLSIRNIETGRTVDPKARTLAAIARALGVSTDNLVA
ncbi:MAG: helix-turn-helix transcriptional regulator [Saccharofermentanales bacterium]